MTAAFELLGERGYADLSVEGIAVRAGVGKTTIYRWWETKPELAVDAFFAMTEADLAFPDTGSAREDFRLQVLQLAKVLRGPVGNAMSSMISGARFDPQLHHAITTRWIDPRAVWGFERMSRAIDDGECVEGVDPRLSLEIIYSPIYARLLFGRELPSVDEMDRMMQIAFRGIFIR